MVGTRYQERSPDSLLPPLKLQRIGLSKNCTSRTSEGDLRPAKSLIFYSSPRTRNL
ncbi:MAG: hypothetical protein ABI180_08760 [Microcoleus sp.]